MHGAVVHVYSVCSFLNFISACHLCDSGAIGDLNPVAVTPKTSPVCNLYFGHLFFLLCFLYFHNNWC